MPLLSYCYKAILQPRASTPPVTQNESETRQVIFVPPLPPAAGQATLLSLRRGARTLSPSPCLAAGRGVLSGMPDCVRRHLPGGTGGYFCWETFLNNWQRKQETTALWSGARCVPMHLLFLAALVLLRRPRGDGRQRGCSLARRWSKPVKSPYLFTCTATGRAGCSLKIHDTHTGQSSRGNISDNVPSKSQRNSLIRAERRGRAGVGARQIAWARDRNDGLY